MADGRWPVAGGGLRFSAAFGGSMAGSAGSSVRVWQGAYDADYNAFSNQVLRVTTDHFGAPQTNAVFSLDGNNDVVDTTVSWDVPVVYGQGSSYQVKLTVQALGPNSTSDFSHTFTLTAVQALDAQDQAVAGRCLAGSGALLPAAPVPEHQTMLMLLTGLGVLGLVHRRRRT